MLVLFETPGGFALFKVLKEKKLKQPESLWEEFTSPDKASKIVKLKAFERFTDAKEALKAATAVIESKVSKPLRRFLKNNIVNKGIQDALIVVDKKLRNAIVEKLGINCLTSSKYADLIRGIRSQLSSLVAGLSDIDLKTMSLGLAHSISRYTLKFSPDKVDTMVVQAINLLDDIDKELNNYAMRLKEWYSWHFPELAKIVGDNVVYSKVVKEVGIRTEAVSKDLSSLVQPDIEAEIKEAAELSMGTEISPDDLQHITSLCEQVINLSDYRTKLYEYLRNRMAAIAPNLTVLVGELVGARLIAHAGSLVNLSKHPASTIQILGAEKALFRAIKTKHDTPKYGLLYHASLVGQASSNIKGKISRSLAAKCALSIRLDAVGEQTEPTIGLQHKEMIESRMRYLENHLTPNVLSGKRLAPYTKPAHAPAYDTSADFPAQSQKRPGTDLVEPPKKKRPKA
jgi:nucleolar protein 58